MRYIIPISVLVTALFAILLPSCKEPLGRELTMSERVVVAAVGLEWQDRGLPWEAECAYAPETMRLLVVDEQGLWEYCYRCPPGQCGETGDCPYGCAFGCLHQDLIVSHEDTTLCGLIVHEAVHWYHRCMGGDGDPFHEGWFWDPVVSTVKEEYCQME